MTYGFICAVEDRGAIKTCFRCLRALVFDFGCMHKGYRLSVIILLFLFLFFSFLFSFVISPFDRAITNKSVYTVSVL